MESGRDNFFKTKPVKNATAKSEKAKEEAKEDRDRKEKSSKNSQKSASINHSVFCNIYNCVCLFVL